MTDFPFRIVGFDLDGTLLDTHGDLGAALNHALAVAGRPPVPVEQVSDLIGGGARQMLERALAITGSVPPADEIRALHGELLVYYRATIAVHSRLYPGGAAMLDALDAHGVKVAVVTNKLEALAVQLLDALGLSSRLAAVLGGDTLGPGKAKPAPDLLHEMQRRLGGGPAAFVGDTTFDTKAAAAAGWPCVAVRFGFNDIPVETMGADAVIDHFDQLVPALQRLGTR